MKIAKKPGPPIGVLLTQGLGVVVGGKAKYYPLDTLPQHGAIEDPWGSRVRLVERDSLDGVPVASWRMGGELPMQLLSRWYGFSFIYPGCAIYEAQH